MMVCQNLNSASQHFLFLVMLFFHFLFVISAGELVQADVLPIPILQQKITGHVHPSICITRTGSLIVVYQGRHVLMCTRSIDLGNTWSEPVAIKTTADRPDAIRQVKKYEIYPGTIDTLPDHRILVTWNYIADDRSNDGYYQRALLYTLSSDQGDNWDEQKLIGPINNTHLGAVRHNVLAWTKGRWLLPLRVGAPRLYHPKTMELSLWPLKSPDGKQHEFQQIVKTTKGTLLAMGPLFLRSTDRGKHWTLVRKFPADPTQRDNAEGRYLTTLRDGSVLVTWGVGHQNKGLRYNISLDDGKTWNANPIVFLKETQVAARYYSARTVQLNDKQIGTVFMNKTGIYFLKVNLNKLRKQIGE